MTNFRDVAGGDPAATRFRAIAALRDGGPMSRAELARQTALAPSTITAIVRSLGEEGIILPAAPRGDAPGGRGRELRLNPDLGIVLGLDFGFRTVRSLVVDLAATERSRGERPLPDHYSAHEGLAIARELMDETIRSAGLTHADIAAVGIALPGPIDPSGQRVGGSAVLQGWASVSAADISEALGVPVLIENDSNLAALGEHVFGAGRDVRDSITIKMHSGIGAGIIVRDELVTGTAGGAGEIGHTLVDARGPLCRCGKRGCLDTYAAVPAILAAMQPLHAALDFPGFIRLIDAGDPGAERVARDAADLVGQAVATACLLLAPSCVVIVGALARAGDVVLDPIRDAIANVALPESGVIPDVRLGSLGDRHTAMGAVALALGDLGWLPAPLAGRA
jgi:predicted NBD/HSP70 family sugar kinase